MGEARWLGGGGYGETGFSVESGYYPLPDLRLAVGYSAGAAYDRDFGEDRSAGGFYLGATAKLSGLLSGFGNQPIAPYQQRESAIDAVPTEPAASLDSGVTQSPREAATTVDTSIPVNP